MGWIATHTHTHTHTNKRLSINERLGGQTRTDTPHAQEVMARAAQWMHRQTCMLALERSQATANSLEGSCLRIVITISTSSVYEQMS